MNELNVDALMRCGLPYHETVTFVRLVQVCQLKGGLWEWLKPMQQSGLSLPRPTLSQRCCMDLVSPPAFPHFCRPLPPSPHRETDSGRGGAGAFGGGSY